MSLPLDFKKRSCFLSCLMQAVLLRVVCWADFRTAKAASFLDAKQLVSDLSKRYLLTRTPLTLHFTLQRTYSKQQLKFSLFETTYLVLFFSQLEQRNISKLVYSIRDASALCSRRFLVKEQIVGILKKKKVRFHSTFHSNTLSD
jgi:hypothetical protein